MGERLRVPVRVRPGASRTAVGGRYGPDVLIVAVSARAVDGAANRAVIEAVAAAFGLKRAAVEIVAGAASRSKTVAISGDREALAARLAALLEG
jgi:uncharacterized protein (TIGR00251 family)